MTTSNYGIAGDTGGASAFASMFDRRSVEIKTVEGGIGEGFGRQYRRRAVAATNVGDTGTGFEFFKHTMQRRQPVFEQIHRIHRPEKTLGIAEQARVMLAPRQAGAGTENLAELGFVDIYHITAWKKPCMQAGWPSAAKITACSGVIENLPAEAS